MPPVFAHGRLRLYLLKLLDEAPRHGYEVIRLLEQRFQGLYAPSAGTVYPRLAKLEAERLVTHTLEGGRKVYAITDAGRSELADRQAELAELELEIHESVAALAADIREDVRGTASALRREVREATRHSRAADGSAGEGAEEGAGAGAGADSGEEHSGPRGHRPPWADQESWQLAKEELRKAKQEWQKQARQARDESRRAREKVREAEAEARRAKQARREAQQATQEEVRRIARSVQEQVQSRAQAGDWQGAVREGMAELAKEMGTLGRLTGQVGVWPPPFGGGGTDAGTDTAGASADGRSGTAPAGGKDPGVGVTDAEAEAAASVWRARPAPEWAAEPESESTDPARDLERLLDRFRDDVRDAARDHGVTDAQLRDIRRRLSTATAHITATLHPDA